MPYLSVLCRTIAFRAGIEEGPVTHSLEGIECCDLCIAYTDDTVQVDVGDPGRPMMVRICGDCRSKIRRAEWEPRPTLVEGVVQEVVEKIVQPDVEQLSLSDLDAQDRGET